MWCLCPKRARRINEKSVSKLCGGLVDAGWRSRSKQRSELWGHPKQRVGLYALAPIAHWVVHSEDEGQLISCHTCTHILDFCEIIFGFPCDSSCLALGPDCSLHPKAQGKYVKISKIAPQNQRECVTAPKSQICVSFYFIHCLSSAASQSLIYSEIAVG